MSTHDAAALRQDAENVLSSFPWLTISGLNSTKVQAARNLAQHYLAQPELPPRPVPEVHRCPQCGGPVERVTQSEDSPLNRYQFDAVKAGDSFCTTCPSNNRGHSPYCYWWDRETTSWTPADRVSWERHQLRDEYLRRDAELAARQEGT